MMMMRHHTTVVAQRHFHEPEHTNGRYPSEFATRQQTLPKGFHQGIFLFAVALGPRAFVTKWYVIDQLCGTT
jgi:hypothetical protein